LKTRIVVLVLLAASLFFGGWKWHAPGSARSDDAIIATVDPVSHTTDPYTATVTGVTEPGTYDLVDTTTGETFTATVTPTTEGNADPITTVDVADGWGWDG
jgi:hypothetical protein